MSRADGVTRISTGTALAYEGGRGGTQWPVTRYTAKVDGLTLTRKDGGERKFKTRPAALAAARIARTAAQTARLASIRESIIAENVSLNQVRDLQGIGESNPELLAGDVLLMEWAGLPE
jgi:hypothetical protein